MDRLIVALHLLDDLGQVLLEIDPVSGVLPDAGSAAESGGAELLFMREQSLDFGAIAAAVLLLERGELLHIARGRLQVGGGLAENGLPGLAGGDGAIELGFRLELAGDLILRGADGGLGAGEHGALGSDAGTQFARQAIHAGEGQDGHHRHDESRQELHGTFVIHGVTPYLRYTVTSAAGISVKRVTEKGSPSSLRTVRIPLPSCSWNSQ